MAVETGGDYIERWAAEIEAAAEVEVERRRREAPSGRRSFTDDVVEARRSAREAALAEAARVADRALARRVAAKVHRGWAASGYTGGLDAGAGTDRG